MTSTRESSREPDLPVLGIESLAGVFHPHAVGVQDFEHYALVVDVRPLPAFAQGHIPGAVRVDPMAAAGSRWPKQHRALAARVTRLHPDAAILVYCGHGGIDSEPLARLLRQTGREVDVLPGGWVNYRQWVLAGLDLLPRLIRFRAVAASSAAHPRRALKALTAQGQQVLDIEALARRLCASARRAGRPPAQALFEGLLLQALRAVDPGRPVWVMEGGGALGPLDLPAAVREALQTAPSASPDQRIG